MGCSWSTHEKDSEQSGLWLRTRLVVPLEGVRLDCAQDRVDVLKGGHDE